MKRVAFILVFSSFVFGAGPATKDDINALRDEMRNNTQMLIKMMETNQDAVNKRFEQIDKRFEQIDKRFEQIDKRFEQVDKRFEQVDKRFEQVDKRFEQVDKRFEMMQHQINTTNGHLAALNTGFYGVIAGIFGLIGFMIWDRHTVVEKAKKEMGQSVEKIIETRLEKKADRLLLDKILEIIEHIAKDDKETQEMLKRHRMNFA